MTMPGIMPNILNPLCHLYGGVVYVCIQTTVLLYKNKTVEIAGRWCGTVNRFGPTF